MNLSIEDTVWALKTELGLARSRLEKMTLSQAVLTAKLEAQEEEMRRRFQTALKDTLIRQETKHQELIQELALNITHQVRNQLGIIQATADSLTAKPSKQDLLKARNSLHQGVQILLRHLEELNDFCRPLDLRLESTELGPWLEETLALINESARTAGLRLTLSLSEALPVLRFDPARMRQAILEILINAIEASPSSGAITISAKKIPETAAIEISVQDQGPGIKPEHRKQLGHPFFTTKAGALGLGLATAKRIILAHQGELRWDTGPSEGTTITIWLKS